MKEMDLWVLVILGCFVETCLKSTVSMILV